MAIDASIPLQSGIAQAPDPLTQYAKFVGVQQAVNQGRLADLQIRSLSTQLARDENIRSKLSALGPNATASDVAGVYMMGGDAPTAVKLQQGAADLKLKQTQTEGADLKNIGDAAGQSASFLQGILQLPPKQQQAAYENGMRQFANSGNRYLAEGAVREFQANPTFNPQVAQAHIQRALSVKDALDLQTKQYGVTVPLPQAVADQKAAIKAAGRNPGGTPYYQAVPIMLPNGQPGLGRFNARTGQMEPISLPGKGGVQAPTMKTGDNAPLQGQIAGAKAGAKTSAEATAKRDFNMAGIGDIIQEAEDVLTGKGGAATPTHSGAGALLDAGGALVGYAPSGAAEADKLSAIGGALVAKMPRMEGPQSDFDVKNYKEMAGQVGNAKLPIERRLAALKEVKRLWTKYDRSQPMTPHFDQPNSQQQAAALPPTNAQGWTLHQDARGNFAYVSPDGKQVQEVQP